MAQFRKIIFGIIGVVFGLCFGLMVRSYINIEIVTNCQMRSSRKYQTPLEFINLRPDELPSNSQNNLVMVGVMTAKSFLKERTKTVYDTWGKTVPGRIAFFSSEGSFGEGLPIIGLKGVDDRYPPQKKSFMMLHYMYEHYIDKFEWFIRADDDVFIRTDQLEHFLRSIDSSKPQFIGQAGKGNNEEFGLLALEYDENFCMGGPGVIFSRETLRRVAPHIPTCLKNLYSIHEDVEIGRCVQKFAGVPCTWNYEMQAILHHNSSGNQAFTGNLKSKEVHNAITLHPVKRSPIMYRIHAYMQGLKAQELRQETLYLHRDISQMSDLLFLSKDNKMITPGVQIFPANYKSAQFLGDPEILGINPNLNKYYPKSEEDILEWNFIAKNIYSMSHSNPKRKMESSMKEGLDDIIREIMENINNYSRQRGRVIEFRDILYAYTRMNSLYGQDLILDLLLIYKKYRGKKMTVPVRRHLYVQRSFTDIQIKRVEDDNDLIQKSASQPYDILTGHVKKIWNTGLEKLSFTLTGPEKFNKRSNGDDSNIPRIVFILPLAGRLNTLQRFLNNFEEICLRNDDKTDLLIPLFVDENYNAIIESIQNLKRKYPDRMVTYIDIEGNFSRGLAIEVASKSSLVSNSSILFFIDVDVTFTIDTLDRIRANTQRNKQIYLPIVFSDYSTESQNSDYNTIMQFDSSESNVFTQQFNINNENGYFREFGYGICAIYKSDLFKPGIDGFITDIKGWGLEDVKFLERIIISNHGANSIVINSLDNTNQLNMTKKSILSIFRSPDTSLRHIYHAINCDKSLEESQLKMCLGTKANTLGSYKFIELLVLRNNSFSIKNFKTKTDDIESK